MERIIFHIDCNKFYASVECLHRPEIRKLPVAVGGNEKSRHGIILTKNEIASKFDLKVGEPLWSARQKCPGLVIIPPNFPLYVRFSEMVRNILKQYTNLIEPFGLDECWIDVSDRVNNFNSAEKLANEIRLQIKNELGITVSIGVSFNKIFAKLGSDYKKPDAVTVFTKQNFKSLVWDLPANDLLFIGPATYRKLQSHYRYTIGDVANTELKKLEQWFGKVGYILHAFANGYDNDPVTPTGNISIIKSISNSTTTPRDLVNNADVKSVMYVLCESVCRRMRDQGFRTRLVRIIVRDNGLYSFTRQKKLSSPTSITKEIFETAFSLFIENYDWEKAIRSVGIAVSEFSDISECRQFDLFTDIKKLDKLEKIDAAVDTLKRRYGNYCVQRASLLKDEKLSRFNPYNDNTIHPVGFFKPH